MSPHPMQDIDARRFKLGVQTIPWGATFSDLRVPLKEAALLGFEGIELSQCPRCLGDFVLSNPTGFRSSAKMLDDLLEEFNLTLLGLAGGSLQTRIDFARYLRHKPIYYYVDHWDNNTASALAEGYSIAFHPHIYMEFATLDAIETLLACHANLKFLPDTAHLFLMGIKLIPLLERYRGRLAGIHLKDWTDRHGWSRVTYARGFTELGNGIIRELSAIKNWIFENYDGWCVIEQDSTVLTPIESLSTSLDWLGITQPSRTGSTTVSVPTTVSHVPPIAGEIAAVLDSQRFSLSAIYKTALAQLATLTKASFLSLWEVNAPNNTMTREAMYYTNPSIVPPPPVLLSISESVAGTAVYEHSPLIHNDLATAASLYRPEFQEFVLRNGFTTVVSLPAHNTNNSHIVDFVINLYFQTPPELPWDSIMAFVKYFALIADTKLNELHADIVDQYAILVPEQEGTDDFLSANIQEVANYMECAELFLYIVSRIGEVPQLRVTLTCGANDSQPHVECLSREIIHPLQEGTPAMEAFKARSSRNLISLWTPTDAGHVRNPDEAVPLLIAPILDAGIFGLAKGVLICRGRRGDPQKPFALHDEIVLDAILNGLGAHLARYAESDRRADAMRIIKHELENPLGCIINAVSDLENEINAHKQEVKTHIRRLNNLITSNGWHLELFQDQFVFSPSVPLLDDVTAWVQTIERVIGGRGFLKASGEMALTPSPVKLIQHIVAPAVNQIAKVLPGNLAASKIDWRDLKKLPVFMLDRYAFMQVVLNLLRNAVKYSQPEFRDFEIILKARHVTDGWEIDFCDNGIGVEEGFEELIFQEGVRGPNAHRVNATGDGFGLWLVKKIIDGHKGRIWVSNPTAPTTFTIFLPATLEFTTIVKASLT